MYNRKFKQMEQSKLKIIQQLKDQIESENKVSNTVKSHLERRTKELADRNAQLDKDKETKTELLE